ncbi:AAA family ATPase [Nocardia sp. NPDC020380]|uniref:nucleotide-binding protein n=1 Tax=Nocardia sp. NPDC020380 TaxID=3364309 RepID=UPI0037AECAE0
MSRNNDGLPMLPPWLSESEVSQSNTGYEAPVENLPHDDLIPEKKSPRSLFGKRKPRKDNDPDQPAAADRTPQQTPDPQSPGPGPQSPAGPNGSPQGPAGPQGANAPASRWQSPPEPTPPRNGDAPSEARPKQSLLGRPPRPTTPQQGPDTPISQQGPDNRLPQQEPDNRLPQQGPGSRLPQPGLDGGAPQRSPEGQLPQQGLAGRPPLPAAPQQGPDSRLPQPGHEGSLPQQNPDSRLPQQGPDNRLPQPGLEGQRPQPGFDGRMPQQGLGSRLPQPGLDGRMPQQGADGWAAQQVPPGQQAPAGQQPPIPQSPQMPQRDPGTHFHLPGQPKPEGAQVPPARQAGGPRFDAPPAEGSQGHLPQQGSPGFTPPALPPSPAVGRGAPSPADTSETRAETLPPAPQSVGPSDMTVHMRPNPAGAAMPGAGPALPGNAGPGVSDLTTRMPLPPSPSELAAAEKGSPTHESASPDLSGGAAAGAVPSAPRETPPFTPPEIPASRAFTDADPLATANALLDALTQSGPLKAVDPLAPETSSSAGSLLGPASGHGNSAAESVGAAGSGNATGSRNATEPGNAAGPYDAAGLGNTAGPSNAGGQNNTAGSGAAGSGTAGSGAAGSGTAGSGTAGSGTAGSGTAGSGTAGSGTAGSDDSAGADAQAGELLPGEDSARGRHRALDAPLPSAPQLRPDPSASGAPHQGSGLNGYGPRGGALPQQAGPLPGTPQFAQPPYPPVGQAPGQANPQAFGPDGANDGVRRSLPSDLTVTDMPSSAGAPQAPGTAGAGAGFPGSQPGSQPWPGQSYGVPGQPPSGGFAQPGGPVSQPDWNAPAQPGVPPAPQSRPTDETVLGLPMTAPMPAADGPQADPRPTSDPSGYAPAPGQPQSGGYGPHSAQPGGYAPGQPNYGYAPGQPDSFASTPGQPDGYAPAAGQPDGYAPAPGQLEGYAPAPGQAGGYAPVPGHPEGYAPAPGQSDSYAQAPGRPEGYAPGSEQPGGGAPAPGQPGGYGQGYPGGYAQGQSGGYAQGQSGGYGPGAQGGYAQGQPGGYVPGQPGAHGAPGMPGPSLDDVPLRRAKKAPAGSGWRRAVHHMSGGSINPGMSAEERRLQELVARIRQPVRGDYRIAVLSLKGGVGKTTTTMGLGSIFSSIRGDRVIAVDANPDFGTLSQRVSLQTRSTVRDLLLDEHIQRYSDVRRHTSQGTSRLEILASERDPAASEAFSEEEYRAVARILQRFYNIILTDCGTGLMHSAMAGVLDLAHSLVLISSSAIDGARSAAATLDWLSLHGHDHLVRNAVVVINLPRPGAPNVGINQLRDYFLSRCRAVHIIPYDPHLGEGAEIDLHRLHKQTKRSYVELAATVADDFATDHRRHRG